jgi:hypothetical protein
VGGSPLLMRIADKELNEIDQEVFMGTSRLATYSLGMIAGAALLAACLVLGEAPAAATPAPGVNLYQDVMSHKATINWQISPDDNYPDDACNVIDSCSSDGSKPKVFVLPPVTIDGRRVGRAVYLVKTKDPKQPEALVFEHQTASKVYFFRVGPDGNISKTAYFERGGNWLLVANPLGQPTFDADAPAWHDALAKEAGSAKPAQ